MPNLSTHTCSLADPADAFFCTPFCRAGDSQRDAEGWRLLPHRKPGTPSTKNIFSGERKGRWILNPWHSPSLALQGRSRFGKALRKMSQLTARCTAPALGAKTKAPRQFWPTKLIPPSKHRSLVWSMSVLLELSVCLGCRVYN